MYQYTDYAQRNDRVQWVSAGVRPIWHFNNRVSLAAEVGADWVKNEAAGTSDTLYKFTLAPQISLGGRFMSRPAIRAFSPTRLGAMISSARWGELDYMGENEGFTYGVEVEAWW